MASHVHSDGLGIPSLKELELSDNPPSPVKMETEAVPGPHNWTLRFKKHKITVLLFVDPVQSFDSIKQLLLDSLKTRGVKEINGDPIPSSVDAVELGVPVNKYDFKEGWVALEIPEQEVKDAAGKKKTVGGNKSIMNANPQGAGLKDGQVLAFRFRVGEPEVDEDGMEVDPKWDVLIPSYDDE